MGENIYSVDVRGKFDLFMDDGFSDVDPDVLIAKIAEEKRLEKEKAKKENAAAKKTASIAKEANKKAPLKEAVKQEKTQKENRGPRKPNVSEKTSENSNGMQSSSRPPRFERRQNQENDSEPQVEGQEPRVGRGGGRGGPRGAPRGEFGGRGSSRGEFSGNRGSSRGEFGGGRGSSRGDFGGGRGSSRGDFGGGRGSSRGDFGGGRGSSRGGRPQRSFDDQEQEVEPVREEGGMEDRPARGRGRGGGRGRGFSGRGGGGRRDFDRHSGSDKTGIKPTEKKEGGGAHNWGTVKDDIEASDVPEGTEVSATTAPADSSAANLDWAAQEEARADEGEQLMTLEEWRAKQSQDRAAKVQRAGGENMRKANDGQDPFSNMAAYRKPKDKTDESDEEEFTEDHKKQTIPIDIRFNDNPRRGGGERGGRGGRGGPRGGRGGGRGGGRNEANIRLDNEDDFPTLK